MHQENGAAFAPFPAGIKSLFNQEVNRYFEDLLPRFITKYWRGAGYTFVAQMLRAHDQDTFETDAKDIKASRRAMKKSAAVRALCPPVEVSGLQNPHILGQFVHVSHVRAQSRVDYDIKSERTVEVYLDCFLIRTWPDEATLRREVLITLFHEYIHYFESFLLSSQQVLRQREQVDAGANCDLAWARRKDRRASLWRWTWVSIGLLIVLAIGASALNHWWQKLMDLPRLVEPHKDRPTARGLQLRLEEVARFQLPTHIVSAWVRYSPLFSTFEPGAAVDLNSINLWMDANGPVELFSQVNHLGCWMADPENVLDRSLLCAGWLPSGDVLLLGAQM